MWSLEYELIAILLLVAIIGLIMGRFLCKSGESEEKRAKEKVVYSLRSTQSDLELLQVTTESQQEGIKVKEQELAQLEQDKSNLVTRLGSAELENQNLLDDLKSLEKYRTRFEALSKEFELQSEVMGQLKAQKGSGLEEIAELKIETNSQKETIAQLDREGEEQEQLLVQMVDIKRKHEQSIQELTELKEANMAQIEEQIARQKVLEVEHKESTEELEKLHTVLEIRVKEATRFDKEYREYREQFSGEKLEELNKKVAQLQDEREDLVSRLRAISSVVGAVGVEEEE